MSPGPLEPANYFDSLVLYSCAWTFTLYLAFSDIEVRLEGSLYAHAGRVEVRMGSDGEWGTVCDDSFDHNAASVVCDMLGQGYVYY